MFGQTDCCGGDGCHLSVPVLIHPDDNNEELTGNLTNGIMITGSLVPICAMTGSWDSMRLIVPLTSC